MVILKTRSQVRSFIKRQAKFHKVHTECTTLWDEVGNGSGIRINLFIDKDKVILKELHWCSGDRGYYKYQVLAKIRIKKLSE